MGWGTPIRMTHDSVTVVPGIGTRLQDQAASHEGGMSATARLELADLDARIATQGAAALAAKQASDAAPARFAQGRCLQPRTLVVLGASSTSSREKGGHRSPRTKASSIRH